MTIRFRTSTLACAAALALAAAVPAAIATAAPVAAATTTYTVTDLGSLGGGYDDATAINASGQVTGYSTLVKEIQVPCNPRSPQKKCFAHPEHAFLYSNGTMTDLGTLGGDNSEGLGINDSGQVVGSSDTKTGLGSAFIAGGGKLAALPGLYADGINDSGQITGTCPQTAPGEHACLDVGGTPTPLPDPTDFTPINCNGFAINNTGLIIGGCDDTSSIGHGILWANGTATDLGISADAINGNGQIVGSATTSSGTTQTFLWSNGQLTELAGLTFTPAAINDSDVIVGADEIYSNGSQHNLNTLIPAGSPYQIDYATGINDNGQIVANAVDTATGQRDAILLTPN